MAKLKWDHSMSVEIASLDQEHNRIISLINILLADIGAENDTNLQRLITELIDYSKEHFKHEERLFEEFNYKNRVVHTKIHNDFINKINDFSSKIKVSSKKSLTKAHVETKPT